jgi:hypothetical protein
MGGVKMGSAVKRFIRVLAFTGIGILGQQVADSNYAMLLTPAIAMLDKWFRDKFMK